MIKIKFPDGSVKEFKEGVKAINIAESIGERLAKASLAAEVDDKIVDMSTEIRKDAKIRFLTFNDEAGKEIFWHSSAHIMAQAVTDLFPDAKPTIGPPIENGFYYDFEVKHPFKPEDLPKIEARMKEIIKADSPFERIEMKACDASEHFKDNPYKIELLEEFTEEPTAYKHHEFTDLCRGPHVPSTGYIKAVKLIKISGAYWKGDANNTQLQRIYGISFPDKKELKKHLELIAEAERRDHRKIGKILDLFSFHEEGPGFPFWHPKGTEMFNTLLDFWREEHKKAGYKEIKTPIILDRALWERSGHWENYKENMYFTKIDERDFAVKPMNCPGGILVFKQHLPSYRDLPIKMGEVGLVHRHELSGALQGLFRVRNFTQDDAHIFMTSEMIGKEVTDVIKLTDKIYKTFGFKYHVELSTRPEKSMGTDEQWEAATEGLRKALEANNMEYQINEGDGAFYGPKIDFHLKDCLGRTWQCGTIQLDMTMPEKFDVNFINKEGNKERVVMIHRTILGSIERFIGILIEHYAGKFPLWIAPEQVRIITVADRFNDYAKEIQEQLKKEGFKVETDLRTESVSYKVREAQSQKVPVIINIGEKELENKTVAVRTLDNKLKFGIKLKDLTEDMKENIKKKEHTFFI